MSSEGKQVNSHFNERIGFLNMPEMMSDITQATADTVASLTEIKRSLIAKAMGDTDKAFGMSVVRFVHQLYSSTLLT